MPAQNKNRERLLTPRLNIRACKQTKLKRLIS